jgi:hypothetical protein
MLQPQVIPAKTGIHSRYLLEFAAYPVDSRFRENDDSLERPCLANRVTAYGSRTYF